MDAICDSRFRTGTTPVDHLRPGSSWRCRCSKFRSCEAKNGKNGKSCGIEQMSNKVWSCRSAGAGRTVFARILLFPAERLLQHPFPLLAGYGGQRGELAVRARRGEEHTLPCRST